MSKLTDKVKNEFDDFNLKLLSLNNKLGQTYKALDRLESNLIFVEELYKSGFKNVNVQIDNLSKEIKNLNHGK